MKPLTAEWVAKVKGDFATMRRDSRVVEHPNFEAVCFHAQPCAETYIKARLCEAGVTFGKIHDLVALLVAVLDLEPAWEDYREDLAYLSAFAVSVRYPGDSPDLNCALDAGRRCHVFRTAARRSPGLDI
ncbi:MAG TPA: HEPN domain-containing protein [Phycisphaerales bacterium]|nr:HEPN domain-containing protein [Phycisphaerales bacterium]